MLNCERERLEFDSLPEFIRESYSAARESYAPSTAARGLNPATRRDDALQAKTAELEALWPGVNHDFLAPSKRSPSFYLTLGFMAGAVVSLVGIWGYSLFSHGASATASADGAKKIVVAGAHGTFGVNAQIASERGQASTRSPVVSSGEVITPLYASYEVKTGDTLAAIALRAYKRVSPRLLDEICKANGMRSANVLNLGQKITLPEYHPQSSQIASGAAQLQ